MAKTEIRGGDQIKNLSILREDLVSDFLGGTDWDISNGANNATITGLSAGVNANDAVNKSQLDALAAAIGAPMRYKGQLDASIPSPDLDAIDNLTGDTYYISASGTYLGETWNVGDMLIVNKDVPSGTTITSADVDKIDNTEASDILRTGDVVDNLTSTGVTDAPLSANQGYVLDQRVQSLESWQFSFAKEKVSVTHNSPTVGVLSQTPIAGSEDVYLNGLLMEEGSGNDYTISGTQITFEYNMKTNDKVIVKYRY